MLLLLFGDAGGGFGDDTLSDLVETPPDDYGIGVPIQATYGAGTWRLAVQIADRNAGSSIVWHDMTGYLSEMRWGRGSDQPWGKFRPTKTPTLLFWGTGDQFARTNPDTTDTFGVHVPLGVNLLIRAVLFRVVAGEVVQTIHLFTNRVRRWHSASRALGKVRFHQVETVDLMSTLQNRPLNSRLEQGWRTRLDATLLGANWRYGWDIYGAETVDDGGGPDPAVTLAARDEQSSALAEVDATHDPVALVWRTRPNGRGVTHPAPWSTFHDDLFDDVGLTVTGTEWVNPLTEFYPAGRVVFSYDPVDDEVGFWPEADGASFDIDSDLEAIVNEITVTHPAGKFNYSDPVSQDVFDYRPISVSWIAQNDTYAQEIVDNQANADQVATPLRTGLDQQGAFPAIAVLDHLDPITIKHTTAIGRDITTAPGLLRSISHQIKARRSGKIRWRAEIQADLFSSETTSGLLPVENLAVDTLEDGFVDWTWTNPTQVIEPTETQVRIPSVSLLWITIAYPTTGFAWLGLPPDTTFTFEVRLIRREDGFTTGVSPVRSVTFRTPAAEIPDPDGGGVITIPPGEPGCVIEWKLESTEDGSSWTLEDSGDESDFDTDAGTGTVTLDLSAFAYESGKLYRLCTRNVCAGTPDAWVCSDPFQPDCTPPAALADPPYDDPDLKVYVPLVCNNEVYEAVTNTLGAKGPTFGSFGVDGSHNYSLNSDGSTEGLVAYGAASTLVGIASSPMTLHAYVNLGTKPTVSGPMWRAGGLSIDMTPNGTKWSIGRTLFFATGGATQAFDTAALNLNQGYELRLTHDPASGDLDLYVDDVLVDHTVVASDRRSFLELWEVYLPANSEGTDFAVWGRVRSGPSVTINQGAGQSDPATGSTIVFDVVFSEAVSGFATGDVTLSGTAGATTATVVDSGDHIHFTVNVTGMTVAGGTVIASIAGGVCTSVATANPNVESTSSDNTVQWGALYTDNFNRPNSITIADGSHPWVPVTIYNSLTIASNELFCVGGTLGAAFWDADLTADQFLEFDVNVVGGNGTNILLRGSAANGTFVDNYAMAYDSSAGGTLITSSILSGVAHTINTTTGVGNPSVPFRFRFEIQGSTLRGYLNGVLKVSFSDSSIPSGGYAGVLLAAANVKVDNMSCGSV